MFETQEVTDVEIVPYETTDDPSLHAHYINPPDNIHIWQPGMKTQEIVDIARMMGIEIVALCKYRWVPKHDPAKHPICSKCVDVAAQIVLSMGY